jgi:hypothetical protein
MSDAGISRATERATLACRALSAAADDMYVAFRRDGMPVKRVAYALEAEAERVCELAQQIERLAERAAGRPHPKCAKARDDSPRRAKAANRRRSASLAAGEGAPPGE